MKKIITVLLLLSSIPVYAEDEIPKSTYLHKGDIAMNEGILLSLPQAQRFHLMDLDLQTCVKVSSLKDDEASIVDIRLKNATEENQELSKRLASLRDDSFFSKVGYFLMGAALTTVIAYGATRAIK